MGNTNIYIETSVLNFYFSDDSPEKRDITKEFFEKTLFSKNNIFISDIVLEEIEKAPEDIKEKLLKLIKMFDLKKIEFLLETETLALKYKESGLIPEKSFNDARHIAIAVLNEIDVLVSWNFKHIVKLKTKTGVNVINNIIRAAFANAGTTLGEYISFMRLPHSDIYCDNEGCNTCSLPEPNSLSNLLQNLTSKSRGAFILSKDFEAACRAPL